MIRRQPAICKPRCAAGRRGPWRPWRCRGSACRSRPGPARRCANRAKVVGLLGRRRPRAGQQPGQRIEVAGGEIGRRQVEVLAPQRGVLRAPRPSDRQARQPGMRVGCQRIGPALLDAQRLHLLGHRDVALAFDRAAGAALAAQRHEGEVLGQDDLDIAVVVLAPGARQVPALRQFVAPRLGGARRVALQLADHGLRRGLPFGGDLRAAAGPAPSSATRTKRDQDFHGELPQ